MSTETFQVVEKVSISTPSKTSSHKTKITSAALKQHPTYLVAVREDIYTLVNVCVTDAVESDWYFVWVSQQFTSEGSSGVFKEVL